MIFNAKKVDAIIDFPKQMYSDVNLMCGPVKN